MMNIPIVPVRELHSKLGFQEPINYPGSSLQKSLTEWKMEIDDAPIFRYIYRNFKPDRHLEFGTWQGTGTLFCLEECDATVWTINIPQGEWLPDGTPVYHAVIAEKRSKLQRIKNKINKWTKTSRIEEKFWRSSDSFGFIGKYYLEAGLGHRVCQLYCDSKQWDIQNYPSDFFDTVLIDGGHTEDVVTSDTRKACQLLRSGGVIMWHDFCPQIEVQNFCSSTQGVAEAIQRNWTWLCEQMDQIFWVNPSWILLGIKR